MKKVICSQKAPGAIGPTAKRLKRMEWFLSQVSYLLMQLPE